MRPGLVTKRSTTVLSPITDNPSPMPVNPLVPCISNTSEQHQQENVLLPPDAKLRHAGSRVLSDIRGVLKVIGKSQGSEASTTLHVDDMPVETQSMISGLPNADRVNGRIESSLSRKGRGSSTRDWVRKIKNMGLGPSGGTVILRSRSGRRRSSVHAPANFRSAPSSGADNSPPSDHSFVENESTGKTSVDSRHSVVAVPPQRRSSRRSFPWKSNPDFSLGTIEESGLDQFLPTIETVEKAAAVKIFLETQLNEKLHRQNARSIRKNYMEAQLYYSPHLTCEHRDVVRGSYYTQETCHLRESRVLQSKSLTAACGAGLSPFVDDYEPLKIIGKGSFGVVRLVREKTDKAHNRPKQVFAMKIIRKSDMLRSSQEGHLRAERDFLVASEGASWVVSLVCSFQDAANLYLVMEYMPGGDFLGLLIRENVLHEAVARFYVAEMILAVEEAHRLRFIHRDVKPDNFLISASGHLKISDFGLAFDGHWSHDVSYYNYHRYSLLKKLGIDVDGDDVDLKESRDIQKQVERSRTLMAGTERHERQDSTRDEDLEELVSWRNRCSNRSSAHSVVGTSQYMAPESIGIILYECLYGHTPFLSEKGRKETKANILDHKKRFFFPLRPFVSDKCQDLMYRLIREKETRLCSRRYQMKDRGQLDAGRSVDHHGRYVFADDGEDIKNHRWFKNVPWDRLHNLTPPFVPHVHGPEDTRYFDESGSIEDMTESQEEASGPSPEDVKEVLKDFKPTFQDFALQLVSEPYDTIKLRGLDHRIDKASLVDSTEKEVLKHFVRMYGRKERKRPRDRVLRDYKTKDIALSIRKKTAFMGYTWRRMRPEGYLGML